jgi:hypothetical protein
MLVLASVAIGGYSQRTRNIWFFCLTCSVLWMQLTNYVHRPDVKDAFGVHEVDLPQNWINISQLESIVGAEKISTPFPIPFGVENQLKETGHFIPDRECFNLLVTNPEAETARTARMDRAQWALIPKKDPHYWETVWNTSPMLGIGYKFYPGRRAPFVYGDILFKELETHWTRVTTVGDWIVYRQNPQTGQSFRP